MLQESQQAETQAGTDFYTGEGSLRPQPLKEITRLRRYDYFGDTALRKGDRRNSSIMVTQGRWLLVGGIMLELFGNHWYR